MRSPSPRGWAHRPGVVLASLSATQFLTMLSWFNFSAILPLVSKEWGLTGTTSGIVIASTQVGYVLSVTLMGFLSDRIGERRIFFASTLTSGTFSVIFAYAASDFTSAVIIRMLMGVGMGGLYVPGMKMIMERFQARQRGAAVGIYTGSLVGAQGVSYVAGPIAAAYGWQVGVLATSIWAFPASLIALAFVKEGPRTLPDGGTRRESLGRYGLGFPAGLITISYVGHTWELYAMRGWIGAFLYAASSRAGSAINDALSTASWISLATVMLGALSPWVGGWMSDRMGRTKSAILILSMSVPCSLAYGWLIDQPIWLLTAIALFYGFWIIADTALFKVGLAELIRPVAVGTALGIQSFIGFGASALSTALFGLVLDMTNQPSTVSALGYFPFWGWAFSMLGVGASVGPLAAYLLMRHPASLKMGGGKR